MGEPRSDAAENLRAALRAAAGRLGPINGEVVIAFGGRLIRGNRATKVSAELARGFASPSLVAMDARPPGASTADWGRWKTSRPRVSAPASTAFDARVWCVDLWPGIDHERLLRSIQATQPCGVIVRLFGVGVAPSQAKLPAIAETLGDAGIPTLAISSIAGARINLHRYESSIELAQSAILDGANMTAEAATTKMMWVLAAESSPARRRRLLTQNLAGELDRSVR